MNTLTQIEGEVLDSMPIAVQQASTALATTDNPYMRMAELAMTTGKVEQLDKLLDLQLRWDAERARKAFVAAMAAFKTEPMEILKRKRVSFATRDGDTTSYTHAELADVADAVVPAMGKHGMSHRWDVKQESGQITVTCILTHSEGHSESVSLTASPDASGKKNAIQQVASTVTYLQRYTLLMATGMATKGMDDDGRASGNDDEVDTVAEQWVTVAERLTTYEEYKARKAEVLTAYGNKPSNLPPSVREAFNKAATETKPKD